MRSTSCVRDSGQAFPERFLVRRAAPAAAELYFDARLGFVRVDVEPLEVVDYVAAAADERLAVVDLVARACAGRLARAGAWVLDHELGAQRARAFERGRL